MAASAITAYKEKGEIFMYLIVGLGNPGKKYEHTRHNVGFDIVEALAKRQGIRIDKEKEGALVGECFIGGKRVMIA